MTRNALWALLLLHRIQLKRSARKPSTYIVWIVGFGVMVAVQQFTGIGSADAADRPGTHGSATALLVVVVMSIVLGGATGPILIMPAHEAQWLATAPGGAAAKIAWRLLLGLLFRWSETFVLILAAQLLTGHPLHPGVANVLGLLYAGLDGTTSGLRYVAAAFYASKRRPAAYRALAAAVLVPLALGVSTIAPVMRALGRPGVDSSVTAYLSALAWLAVAFVVATVAVRNAESLVIRAIASGNPTTKAAEPARLTSRGHAQEPDAFRLVGAKAYLWLALIQRRRQLPRILIVHAVTVGATVALAVLAPAWALIPVGLAVLFDLMVSMTVRPPAPVATDRRTLPFPIRHVLAWQLGYGSLTAVEMVGLPLSVALAWAVVPGVAIPAALICLLPFGLLTAAISHLPLVEGEPPADRRRRVGLLMTAGVVPAAVIAGLVPGSGGAILAGGWLLMSTAGLAAYGLRQLEATLAPPRHDQVLSPA